MGINAEEAKFILALKKRAGTSDNILCLGRPELFVSRAELARLSGRFGKNWSQDCLAEISDARFAEPFLKACGFDNIRSLDASHYEGAEIIHDLNLPVPMSLEGTSGFVYDGGTLEHVFDIAVALRNTMKLTRTGGILCLSTPANGQCGHGFYQFSPELYFRALEANGFDQIEIYLVAMLSPARWYRVTDPRKLGRRIQFSTSEAVQMFVVARKVTDFDRFTNPQQSDYADAQWSDGDATAPVHAQQQAAEQRSIRAWETPAARWKGRIKDRLLFPALVITRHLFGIGMPGIWQKEHFTAVDPYNLPPSAGG